MTDVWAERGTRCHGTADIHGPTFSVRSAPPGKRERRGSCPPSTPSMLRLCPGIGPKSAVRARQAPTPSSFSTAGTRRLGCSPHHHPAATTARHPGPSKMSGKTCARMTSATTSGKTTRPSSMPAARHGTSSSPCPSGIRRLKTVGCGHSLRPLVLVWGREEK